MNFTKYIKRAAALVMAFLLLTGGFSNKTFAAEQSAQNKNIVSIIFEVTLEIEGDTPDDAVFTFIIDEDDGAPTPDVSYTAICGEGTAEFGEIDFTQPGEYEYTIYERNDGIENYIYDTNVYSIDVKVQYDNKGQLFATYTAYSGDAKEPEIMFINEYDDTPISEETTLPEETTLSEETTPSETTTSSQENSPSPLEETETTVTDSSTESMKPSKLSTSNSDNPSPTSNKSSTAGSPKTGDDTNSIPWIVLLFVAVIGAISCMWYLNITKNRGRDEDES